MDLDAHPRLRPDPDLEPARCVLKGVRRQLRDKQLARLANVGVIEQGANELPGLFDRTGDRVKRGSVPLSGGTFTGPAALGLAPFTYHAAWLG
jgi:hypothetical protein